MFCSKVLVRLSNVLPLLSVRVHDFYIGSQVLVTPGPAKIVECLVGHFGGIQLMVTFSHRCKYELMRKFGNEWK